MYVCVTNLKIVLTTVLVILLYQLFKIHIVVKTGDTDVRFGADMFTF